MQFTQTDPQNFIDIPEHVDYLNLMIDKANGILGNVGESLYGSPTPFPYPNGASHIYDSRLFLDLQEIVFVQNALGWNNNGNTCGSFNYIDQGADKDCVFDIFIIGGGRFSGCGPENFVVIPDYYTDYVQYLDTGGACCTSVDAHAWNLLHEVGHSFGLQHSWIDQFDDIICGHCVPDQTGACVINCGTSTCDPITDPNCWNNIMSYTFFRKRNFTPHQLAAMHLRSFSKNNHLIYLNVELDNTAPLTINQEETWDFARIVEKNIIVEEGAKLTIRCKVVMAPEATITVKKGGALLVDGGHITTTGAKCDQYWGGIIVEGNPGASQSLTSQGDVKLENGALLEFANTAVVVQGGGRLRAFSSTIKDCRYGFYFYPYTSPSVPNYNVSYVSDCSFSVTDEHTLDLQPFVSLFGVNAINFNDCTFADERTTVALPNYSYALSTGIYALDSRFRVAGTNTSFDDLYMAISVGTTGKPKNYTVRQATFNNCFGGILSRGINAAFIKDNNFTIGDYDLTPIPGDGVPLPQSDWGGFGINLQSGSGFRIEDNIFTRSTANASQAAALGIYVNNTGGAANTINNNEFNRIVVGNYAQGENANNFPFPSGLEYLCNDNNTTLSVPLGAAYDFYVHNESNVSSLQGSPEQPAGNTFRNAGFAEGNDFRNNPLAQQVQYYYYGSDDDQVPDIDTMSGLFTGLLNVDAIINFIDQDCNGSTGPDDDRLTSDERQKITLNYNAARTQFTTDLASYLADLDGGKTAEILDFIAGNVSSVTFTTAFGTFQVSTPQQLLSALQGISPYVSAPVLAALSESTTTYPRNTFLSLASQNPESLATGSLLYQIEGDRNLTTTEMNNLQQQATVTTARTAIELQLHEDYNTMQKNGQYLIIDQLADPNRTTDTELLTLLEDQYDQASDYALIAYATAQNNASQVANYTALLEEKISSDWQKLQYNQFEAFNTLGNMLQATSRSWNDLQATEITQLEQMVQANAGLPSAQARSVLQAYYGYHYLKLPAYPGASPGVGAEALQTGAILAVDQRVEEKKSTETAAILSVEANPNPAKSTVQFSIQIPANCHFANLTIFDLNGQQVYSNRVLNGQQSVSWFPNNLQAGIYYYYLETLDRRTNPQKIVLLK